LIEVDIFIMAELSIAEAARASGLIFNGGKTLPKLIKWIGVNRSEWVHINE